MTGLFIPEITTEMFRNGCLESIETLMAEGEVYDIEYPLEQEQKTDIDSFVDFLITENCEGCTECEPRLAGEESFACYEEGRAKWFMEMAKRFKESEG